MLIQTHTEHTSFTAVSPPFRLAPAINISICIEMSAHLRPGAQSPHRGSQHLERLEAPIKWILGDAGGCCPPAVGGSAEPALLSQLAQACLRFVCLPSQRPGGGPGCCGATAPPPLPTSGLVRSLLPSFSHNPEGSSERAGKCGAILLLRSPHCNAGCILQGTVL